MPATIDAHPADLRQSDARAGARRVLALALLGLALAGIVAAGFSIPLGLWRYPEVVATPHPLATVLGSDALGALRFVIPTGCAFAVYAIAVALARTLRGRQAAAVVLGIAALLVLPFVAINPLASHDIYHNVADARALWLYGDNPLSVPPAAYPDDPLALAGPAWQSTPSVYGPVWYAIAGAPLPFAGDSLRANVIGQKLLTGLFLLAVTALAMWIAGEIRPGAAAAAGVLVGWNPLLQFETAGNAHNGIVMVCFALVALAFLVRRRWTGVFPFLALAVATKYLLAVFGPLLLIWMLRRREVPRRQIALSLSAGAVLGALLLAIFLGEGALLEGFRRETGFTASSPTAFLHAALVRWLALPSLDALTAARLVLVPLFLAGYTALLVRLWRDASLVGLIHAGVWSIALLLGLVATWFGPWYAVILVPFAALLPERRVALVAGVFSASVMLMYVPMFWLSATPPLLLHGVSVALAVVPAVVAGSLPVARRWSATRGPEPALGRP